MIMANEILHYLTTTPSRPTNEASKTDRGIYGLFDHEGHLSYIGSTKNPAENFYKRIHSRHRTGSEDYSHYFSKVYNTGRMWRDRHSTAHDQDAKIAKGFRNSFIAEYCSAVWFPLHATPAEIVAMEMEVIQIAPARAKYWNANTRIKYPEPIELVDSLIEKLGVSMHYQEAMRRQGQRCAAAS
tara:strand:- start:2386 stop:2937 length:552 start_codon:yes stop_codon:yes gene_type:complete